MSVVEQQGVPGLERSGARLASDARGLARYRDLYLWMLIPMAIMQAGICSDY
jgi:hypothetical protein